MEQDLREKNVAVERMHALADKAKEIVGGARHEAYGDPASNHGCTAEMFTSYLRRRGLLKPDATMNARDVCMLNALQKISRDAHWQASDNVLDLCGYAMNAEACADYSGG